MEGPLDPPSTFISQLFSNSLLWAAYKEKGRRGSFSCNASIKKTTQNELSTDESFL